MSESNFGDGIKSGRPFLFTDPKELAIRIQSYFDEQSPRIVKRMVESGYNNEGHTIFLTREVMTEQQPLTATGLALHLGVSRQTLLDYKKAEHYSDEIEDEVRQELMDTVEKAYQRIEAFNEQMLFKNGLANGVKFNLTNNFGWVDKSVVDSNVKTVAEELDALDDDQAEKTKEQRTNMADQAAKALEGEDDTPRPEVRE